MAFVTDKDIELWAHEFVVKWCAMSGYRYEHVLDDPSDPHLPDECLECLLTATLVEFIKKFNFRLGPVSELEWKEILRFYSQHYEFMKQFFK